MSKIFKICNFELFLRAIFKRKLNFSQLQTKKFDLFEKDVKTSNFFDFFSKIFFLISIKQPSFLKIY